jgi:hypothetical protein
MGAERPAQASRTAGDQALQGVERSSHPHLGQRMAKGRLARGAVAYGWYFSSTVSADPALRTMVTRTVTLFVFAAVSSWASVHFEVP